MIQLSPAFTLRQLFTPLELLFWVPWCGLPLVAAIAAAFTKQDPPVPPVGWIILSVTIACMWGVCAAFFARKAQTLKQFHFASSLGFWIGWLPGFDVSPHEVEDLVIETISTLRPKYPGAEGAIKGCAIYFREPTWTQDVGPGFVAAKLAGAQQDTLMVVGWRKDLRHSALRHEVAHRIIQVCDGSPTDDVAHLIMGPLGLL